MTFRGCLLCLAVTSIISSCKNESETTNTSTPAPSTIMPLRIGNQWTHRFTYYDSLGNVTSSTNITTSIVSDTVIENERWFFWNDSVFTNRQDGLWYLRGGLLAKYPANRNDTYRYGTDTLHSPMVRVLSVDSLIVVPMGTFSCYVYEWTETTLHYVSTVSFYCPNKGLIRKDQIFPAVFGHNSYLRTRIELVGMTTQ